MGALKTSDGITLGYRELGRGEETVLLVHGWMVTGRVWEPLLGRLEDHRLVVPDLRGAGSSPADPGTLSLDRFATDLAELLAALDVRAHVVGHSMGAQVAMALASKAPERVRSLALVSAVPPDGLRFPDDVAGAFRAAGGNAEALGGILDSACTRLAPEDRARLVEDALGVPPATIAVGFDAFARGGVDVSGIRAPTLVVGTDDPFLPHALLESGIVARIPGARFEALAGPGHYPQHEASAELEALLRRFWPSVAS